MNCEKCGGTMSPNQNKKAPNHPDWICNQDNGKCGGEGKFGKWFPTGAWNKTFNGNVAETKQAQATQPQNGKVSPDVWEAKDRMNCMQTAINAASTIHESTGKIEEALADALRFYDLLRQAKAGVIQRYKAPVSSAGKKIARVIETQEEDINVEDIPFN